MPRHANTTGTAAFAHMRRLCGAWCAGLFLVLLLAVPVQAAIGLHVASLRELASADSTWAELVARFGDALGNAGYVLEEVEIPGQGTFYRMVAGPLDEGTAQALNQAFAAAGEYSRIVDFPLEAAPAAPAQPAPEAVQAAPAPEPAPELPPTPAPAQTPAPEPAQAATAPAAPEPAAASAATAAQAATAPEPAPEPPAAPAPLAVREDVAGQQQALQAQEEMERGFEEREEAEGNPLTPDNLLILNMRLKDGTMLVRDMLGYYDQTYYYLPLQVVTEALNFAINVIPGQGTASGWFISEERTFELDVEGGEVTQRGATSSIPMEFVLMADDDIYVASDILSGWFPVDFDFNIAELTVEVTPREALPFQSQAERRGRAKYETFQLKPTLPVRDLEYKMLDVPNLDFSFRNNISKDESQAGKDPTNKLSYNFRSQGDLAYLSTSVYGSGSYDMNGMTKDSLLDLSSFRITGERVSHKGDLLGPLRATKLEVGDIIPPRTYGYTSGMERGVQVNNLPLGASLDFDFTSFSGEAEKDWDVELYRNRQLVDSMIVGEDGLWRFDDVPLQYGRNDFEIRLFGPKGEKRVIKKSKSINNAMVAPGNATYEASVSQKYKRVVEDANTLITTEDDGSYRYVGKFGYGLTQDTSLYGGINSVENPGVRNTYLHMGLANVGDMYAINANGVHDTSSGDMLKLSGTMDLGIADLTASQDLFFNNYMDQDREDEDSVSTRYTSVSLRPDMSFLPSGRWMPSLSTSLGYTRNTYQYVGLADEETSTQYSGNLGLGHSIMFGDVTFANSGSWTTERGEHGTPQHSGSGRSRISGRIGKFNVLGLMDYQLVEPFKTEDWKLRTTFELWDNVGASLGVDGEDFKEQATYTASLNWRMGRLTISPSVAYKDNSFYNLTTDFKLALMAEPRTGEIYVPSFSPLTSGAVSVRVYLDKNRNLVFDEGDKPLEGVVVKAAQMFRKKRTNENGIAYIAALSTNRPTDIIIERGSLPANHAPSTPGEAVFPRKGKTYLLDYPVNVVGSVDGSVVFLSETGEERPLINAEVVLLDESGAASRSVKTDSSGYYMFVDVHEGTYRVGLSKEYLARREAYALPSPKFRIEALGEQLFGFQDLVVYASQDTMLENDKDKLENAPEHMAVEKALTGFSFQTPDDTGLGVEKAVEGALEGFGPAPEEAAPAPEAAAPAPATGEPYALTPPEAAPEAGAALEGAAGQALTGYGVHLESYASEAEADRAMFRLRREYDGLLGEMNFTIQRADLGARGVVYRVVAGPLSDEAAAESLKERFQARNVYAAVLDLGKS